MTHLPDRSNNPAEPLLTELLDCWTPRALSLARRITADERLAEEVVQEALVAYWRNPGAFDRSRGSLGSWFLALVHHKAVDAVRREQAHRRRADAVAADHHGREVAPDVADAVIDGLTDLRVRAALAALPEAQRHALVLAYWGGCTQGEIARRTGVPLGTVKSRMLAGMRRLAERLGPAPAPVVVDVVG